MENQLNMELPMSYLQKENWAHLLKRWRAINSFARHSLTGMHSFLDSYRRKFGITLLQIIVDDQ